MKHIYLIGFMGCGKSTIASYLSKNHSFHLIEMDEQIEQSQLMTIPEIFEMFGEPYFRNLETELIRSLKEETRETVVSCGGGVAMNEVNVEEMRKNGTIIWLKVKPETVFKRVKNSTNRPLLNGNMNVEYISKLIEKRTPKYQEAADLVVEVDGKSPKEIANEILYSIKYTK